MPTKVPDGISSTSICASPVFTTRHGAALTVDSDAETRRCRRGGRCMSGGWVRRRCPRRKRRWCGFRGRVWCRLWCCGRGRRALLRGRRMWCRSLDNRVSEDSDWLRIRCFGMTYQRQLGQRPHSAFQGEEVAVLSPDLWHRVHSERRRVGPPEAC